MRASSYDLGEGELRLVGGVSDTMKEGRLEIYLRGEWGTVCDIGFGLREANVACRQLGFSSSSTPRDDRRQVNALMIVIAIDTISPFPATVCPSTHP